MNLFTAGINYLTSDSVDTTNQTRYDIYLTHTWQIFKSSFQSHVTYA